VATLASNELPKEHTKSYYWRLQQASATCVCAFQKVF